MSTILITGANRGIGLALTKAYLADGHDVIATARDVGAATDLNATKAEVHPLTVDDAASVASLKRALGDRPIDILINNAGIADRAAIGGIDYDAFETSLAVNVIAPVRIAETFAENVAASDGKMIANISSQLGSIEISDNGWGLVYRTTKAGLNMAMRAAAVTLAEQGITTLVLHPGHVETDMGGDGAPVKPDQSAAGLKRVISEAGPAKALRFMDYTGKTLPW